jgi:hypothetical protein
VVLLDTKALVDNTVELTCQVSQFQQLWSRAMHQSCSSVLTSLFKDYSDMADDFEKSL